MTAEQRLVDLGITLPALEPSIGNYVHGVQTGNLLFLSGKGPINSFGKVGAEVSIEHAHLASRSVGLYLLAAMREELGSLDRVSRIVKLLGMVNATPEFTEHPKVINGCSDLFEEVFGVDGRHARSSVGVGSLPGNIVVEIEAIVELKD